MEIALLITCLTVTTAIGWSLLNIISRGSEGFNAPCKAALGYGLGMGAVTFQMFLYYFIRRPITLNSIVLPWIPVVIAGLFFVKPKTIEAGPDMERLSMFERLLLCGISFQSLLIFFRAFLKPLESFDSIAMYAMRAKIIFLNGMIPANYFSEIAPAMPNADYPLLLPLAEAWIYTFLGSLNDFLVKGIFPLYFICMLAASFLLMRRFISRKASLIFTFVMATVPQLGAFATVGYADIVLTYYYTIGAGYLFLWAKERRTRDIVVAGAFLGFAMLTKNEGIAMFLTCLICLGIYLFADARIVKFRALFKVLPFILVVIILAGPWFLVRDYYGLENDLLRFGRADQGRIVTFFKNLDRSPVILYEYQKQFFGPKKWNIAWIVMLALFALNIKAAFSGGLKYITMSILLVLSFYGSVYILMKADGPINWYVATGVSRLFIHILPITIFWIAYLSKDKGLVEEI
jgi:hypothetical protein